MSEELLQRNLREKIGTWDYYNIGSTTVKQLKKWGIIRSINYENIERKKVDAIIMEKQSKKVIAIVEFKSPKNFNTQNKKNQAIQQEIEVAKGLKTNLIIATDRQETLWINVETGNSVKNEDGKEFKYNFDEKDPNLQKFIEKILNSINKNNDKILPKKIVDPTGLAKQVWQDIWISSGENPESCLYTFVEIFIFKYLSDLGILKGNCSFDNLFSQYKNSTPNAVLSNYARSIRPEIKDYFPEGSDGTTIINGTIFVNKKDKAVSGYGSVFKKVLERFKNNGELKNIDYDFKSKLFESFLKESISRKNWGQYFTPLKVVRAINKMAGEPKEGMKICDPACGVGKFPLEFIKDKLNEFFEIKNDKIVQKIWIKGFDKGFGEKEQKTIILAKANMLIYFCELIKYYPALTKEFAKLFNESFVLKTDSTLGTLSDTDWEGKFDLILTNPPYVMSGSSNLKREINENSKLKNYYKTSAMGLEGLFMEWIVKALKLGTGKAFIVVPDGILVRQNDKKLRKFILDNCYIDALISLPIDTFFRNPKKTYILALTRKNNTSEKQTSPVFTYLVSEIGESRDINRFRISRDDLNEAVILFQYFKANKKNFHEFQETKPDKRCKLWEISQFETSKDWVIDRWWTKEELIELEINKKETIANLNTFSGLVGNISDKLKDFSISIKEISENKTGLSDFKEILISDIFEIKKGSSKYTKKFINENPGEYPVYSSQTDNDGIIGKINSYDYECECLTWTTDGYAGIVFLRKGKFSMTTHCGALIFKKNQNLSLDFIYWYLSENLKEYAVGNQNKRITVEIIKNIKIKVPITKENEFDLSKQKKIVEKYRHIKKLRDFIKLEKQKIDDLVINIEEEKPAFKQKTIGEIFDLSIGTNSSKLTKFFVDSHQGNIPVYGASWDENSVNYGFIQDNLPGIKYFENCLTWNRNGSIGKVFYRKGRFSLSSDARPLIIKNDYKENVDLLYLKYTTEKELTIQNFDFNNKAGKDKIKNIEIKIPITSYGKFDLVKQKELVENYKQIEEIKEKIKKDLEKIEDIKVDISI